MIRSTRGRLSPTNRFTKLLPFPRGRELGVIKWGVQSLISKIFLQRLANFSGRHEDHNLPPVGEGGSAQLSYDLRALTRKHLPAEQRDVGSIHATDKNPSTVHSKGSQNSLLHLLSGSGREGEN